MSEQNTVDVELGENENIENIENIENVNNEEGVETNVSKPSKNIFMILKNYTDGVSFRKFDKQGNGGMEMLYLNTSLSGLQIFGTKFKYDIDENGKPLLSNGKKKVQKDVTVSFPINDDLLPIIKNNILNFLGYETGEGFTSDELYIEGKGDITEKSFKMTQNLGKIVVEIKNKSINKETGLEEVKGVKYDFSVLEVYKLLKNVFIIENVLKNSEELGKINTLNYKLSKFAIKDNFVNTVKGNDGTDREIALTTIQNNNININNGILVGSFLKFRNQFLHNQNEGTKAILGNKYPLTIVTQEIGYSFSLPIEEEYSILLEKFLKAFTHEERKNPYYLTDKEEQYLKQMGILNIYNYRGTDMYQFKIYSETGTIQFSINSKDKSLTVVRMGVASEKDVSRVRSNLQKIKEQLQNLDPKSEDFKKLSFKYKKLIEFGTKLSDSYKSTLVDGGKKVSYATSYVKIENPVEFIFRLNLINGYLTNPLKHEKEKLSKVGLNLQMNIEKDLEGSGKYGPILEEYVQYLKDESKGKNTFFKMNLKYLNNDVVVSYDSRGVKDLLNQEDGPMKPFKISIKVPGKDELSTTILNLNDIKSLKELNGETSFKKTIEYTLDAKEIFKEIELTPILKDGNPEYVLKYSPKKGETYEYIIPLNNILDNGRIIHDEIIVDDIFRGNFYDKNIMYNMYKINESIKKHGGEISGENKSIKKTSSVKTSFSK